MNHRPTMDTELDLLLGTAIDSLVKLEVLLYFHQRPGLLQTPADISARLRRALAEVASALQELARNELIARFSLGTGRHVMYGSSEDPHVQALLDFLSQQYHRDPATRARIIQEIIQSKESHDPTDPPCSQASR